LQHAYEHKPSEAAEAVPTLPGRSGIGNEQVEAFVVADRRGGNTSSFGDLPDGQQWL
jgi:hypothetical protein